MPWRYPRGSGKGGGSGIFRTAGVIDPDAALQLYALSFNSAQPGDAALNWDAIFEATLRP